MHCLPRYVYISLVEAIITETLTEHGCSHVLDLLIQGLWGEGKPGLFHGFFDSLHDFSFRFLVRESEGSSSGFHKENMVRRTL